VIEDVGDPYTRIVEEAQRFDLIVLGRHTHFRFATQAEECDTLQRVLRDSPRPVVCVPARPAQGSAVVVAYDGSLQAARAVFAFQGGGLTRAGPVHLVSASDDFDAAAQSIDRAAEFFGAHAVPVTRHPVRPDGSVAKTVIQMAQALDAGLIVAGAYGRSTLREFFLGSVTRSLLKESPASLFLFH
jgi:nucleotide-binding universal stress UspA family protein